MLFTFNQQHSRIVFLIQQHINVHISGSIGNLSTLQYLTEKIRTKKAWVRTLMLKF